MTPVQFHRQQAIRLCGCVGVLQPDPGAFVTVVTVTATCPLADPRNPEYSIWCRHDNISNLQLGGEGYVVLGSLGIRQQSIVLLCPPHIHAQTQLRFECSQSRSHHHGCPHSRVVEEGDQWKRGISGRGGSVEEGDQWKRGISGRGGSVECAKLPQKQRHLSLSQQVCQLVKAS
jgi:hypothetical protein